MTNKTNTANAPNAQFSQYKPQLRRAYDMIKGGQKAEAFELIRPILAQQPDYLDAWWLAAFAAPGPRESAFACQKILTLKPDHWPAQQMLSEQQRLLTLNSIAQTDVVDSAKLIPLKKVRRKRRRARLSTFVIIIGILVLAVGGFLLSVNITGNTFGLPIGGFFNYTGDIVVPDAGAMLSTGRTPGGSITSSLVIGAKHEYRFFGRANSTLFATVQFVANNTLKPGENFVLIDPNGVRLAVGVSGQGSAASIMAQLPVDGRYTFRLTGALGKAQGAYTLMFGYMNDPTSTDLP